MQKKKWLKYVLIITIAASYLTGCTKEDVQSVFKDEKTEETAVEDQTEKDEADQVEVLPEEEAAVAAAEAEQKKKVERAQIYDHYGGLLHQISYTYTLPDNTTLDLYHSPESEEYNQYAIFDVDLDGREELILSITDTYTAGMVGQIYGWNPETAELTLEMSEYPMYTCYENGTITIGWPHNQGLGPDFWPYFMFTYDAADDIYTNVGWVDTWDSNYFETNYDGEPFPEEVDEDGDGVVYYICDADGNGADEPKDNKDYETWVQQYIGDASPVEIPWQGIAYDNYCDYYAENVELFLQEYKKKDFAAGNDIGLWFMENMDAVSTPEALEDSLEQNYGVEMNRLSSGSFVYEVQGELDGTPVYSAYREGPPAFTYKGKQIGDVTVCGVYPGMKEEEAIALLKELGFYYDEDSYVTGIMENDYGITLNSKNGIISEIAMYYNHSF